MALRFKDLLEARAHFGHKKRNWNPKMEPYIYTHKNGLHIIDLRKSVEMLRNAYQAISNIAAEGGEFLFVGTKRQARNIVKEAALRVGASYVNERWLGGTLTNYKVIRKSIKKYNELVEKTESEEFDELSPKKQSKLLRQRDKMERHFEGIKEMKGTPDLLYVVDVVHEDIAIKEANILGIPVVAITDTNSDPETVNYPIPANDDAIESIKLITGIIETAIDEGRSRMDDALKEEAEEKN